MSPFINLLINMAQCSSQVKINVEDTRIFLIISFILNIVTSKLIFSGRIKKICYIEEVVNEL